MTRKLPPHAIEKAQSNLNYVKLIDESITWLGKDAPDKVAAHGKAVRAQLGTNRLTQFLDDQLGEILLCAVINALLDRRADIVNGPPDFVEYPAPPCPRQTHQLSD